MTVVTSRIVCTDGSPAAGVYIYAWLRSASTARVDGARIAERINTHTDRDGRWRLELPPATRMADPNALWSIREVGYDAFLVAVPDRAVPVEASTVTIIPGEPSTGGEAGPLPGFTLDDNADVDAPPGVIGLLERQLGGIVRPVTRAEVLVEHVEDSSPHPAYDDLPSLTVLFENRLV